MSQNGVDSLEDSGPVSLLPILGSLKSPHSMSGVELFTLAKEL